MQFYLIIALLTWLFICFALAIRITIAITITISMAVTTTTKVGASRDLPNATEKSLEKYSILHDDTRIIASTYQSNAVYLATELHQWKIQSKLKIKACPE